MSDKIVVLSLGLPHLEGGELTYATSPALDHPALTTADVLIAGKSQLALLPDFSGQKLPVTGDMESLVQTVEANYGMGRMQVALATGDAGFFGLGSTLATRLGRERVTIVPAVGSLQSTSALLGFSPAEVVCVSLHGPREWCLFETALMTGRTVFLLTDSQSHPGAIARYMRERGRNGYAFHVLGGLHWKAGMIEALESNCMTVEEACAWQEKKSLPRVVVLIPMEGDTHGRTGNIFGLEDNCFVRSDNVMTKKSARITALGLLGISPAHTVWDLGAGVGSVAVEASRLAYRGRVFAVERDPSRVEHIRENKRLMGAANLTVISGELPHCLDLCAPEKTASAPEGSCSMLLPRPDRIFIGGGLGGTPEEAELLLEKAWKALLPGGRMEVAGVLFSTLERCRTYFLHNAIHHDIIMVQAAQAEPLGKDSYMRAANPVQFIIGYK